MAILYSCMGQHEEALNHLDQARELEGGGYFTPGLRIFCLARLGHRQEALLDLEMMKFRFASTSDYVAMHQFACAYAGLGEEDLMFECLDESMEQHDIQTTVLHAWPYFFDYHLNPRFLAYFTQMGLPPP
jgi:hypothetical protein